MYHLRLRHKTAAISYLHLRSSLSSIISVSCNLNLCKLMRGARWTRVKERAAGYSGRWPLERLSGLIWHPRNATSILLGFFPSNGSSSIGTSRTDKLTRTNADLFARFCFWVNRFKAVGITFAYDDIPHHFFFYIKVTAKFLTWGLCLPFHIVCVVWYSCFAFWSSVKGLISTSALPEPMTTSWQHVPLEALLGGAW